MGLKNRIFKFSGKMTKEKWLLLLLIGVLLMILSVPLPGSRKKEEMAESQTASDLPGSGAVPLWTGDTGEQGQPGSASMFAASSGDNPGGGRDSGKGVLGDGTFQASAPSASEGSYEAQMENRIKNLLKSVDGVGKVDVMVVLKSSSEKVMRIDRSTSSGTTREKDSGGGTREIANSQSEENTVLSGSGSNGSGNVPIVEKELSPEISGIIISAEGGGSPVIKAEISEAMEALFGLPPHKIKVLKRVE